MQSLESCSSLSIVLKNNMGLYWLAKLQLMSLFQNLNMLVESSDMIISLIYLLFVLSNFMLQLLNFPSLVIN